jgi:hypothetical protein
VSIQVVYKKESVESWVVSVGGEKVSMQSVY